MGLPEIEILDKSEMEGYVSCRYYQLGAIGMYFKGGKYE